MQTRYKTFEVVIADNASTDGSREWILENYPECRVIHHDRNYGYAEGNNRAADMAKGDILVFLNNDVMVDEDWLNELVKSFEEPSVAIAQPKIRSYRNPENFEYAGAAGGYLDLLGYPFCRGRLFDTVERDEGQYDDPARLFWASGAALAIRRELFLENERFDTDFEFHMEEIDLCWRLLNRRYQIRFAPKSVVWHLGGGSLATGDPKKCYYNFRNSLQMLWKNASTGWLKRYFFLRLLLDGVAAIYAVMKGNFRDMWAIFNAHAHFYSSWSRVHKKRTRLQKHRLNHAEPNEMISISIIGNYFLRGRRTFSEVMERLEQKRP